MSSIISRDELKKLIDNKGKYILIDVRQKEELPFGMIPTAQNIPLHELEEALEVEEKTFKERYKFDKPKNKDLIIFYCRTGGRSGSATKYAVSIGYVNAKNYAGSVYDWSEIDPNVHKY